MNNWMPGAKIITGPDSGPMLGGPRKVVWHTTESDPTKTSAANIAHYLVGTGNTVHLVWNPISGEIVQMIPADRGGQGLENRTGGVQTNRGGTLVIQIEVVGRASQPFTNGPCVGLPKIQAWLGSLGVPAVWSGTEDRSTVNWAKGGHFGHMDVPENAHWDPGKVDKAKLASTSPPEVDMPLTEAEMAHIADLTVHRLLLTKLGKSDVNVAMALEHSGKLDSPDAKAIAAAVTAAVVTALAAKK